MEVILKTATYKECEDLREQLDEAHAEISDLKAYVMLKDSEILYLKEKIGNESLKTQLIEKELILARKEFELQLDEARRSSSTCNESVLNISQEKDSRILEL